MPETAQRVILRVTTSETMYVSVTGEEAERLLPEHDDEGKVIRWPDSTDQGEAVTRYKRIAGHRRVTDGDLTIDTEDHGGWWEPDVIDGDDRERYLWSAREFVGRARYELSCGRYREGRCPELDAVNGDLARLEDRLRLMAMEVERPDDPEVVAWRAK